MPIEKNCTHSIEGSGRLVGVDVGHTQNILFIYRNNLTGNPLHQSKLSYKIRSREPGLKRQLVCSEIWSAVLIWFVVQYCFIRK